MKLLGKISAYEKIVAYLKNENAVETDLTAHEKSKLDRCMTAFTLIRNYNSIADTAAILMKMYPGLSRATAYRDCADSQNMFGDFSRASKEAIRHLSTEIVRDALILAKAKNDYKVMILAAEKIALINGVNILDPEMPDFSKFEPNTYKMGLPQPVVNLLIQMTNAGVVDLSMVTDAMQNMAEEAEVIDE